MEANELHEARTNPEFLKFLAEKEENALKNKNLKELYEVLDSTFILDLDSKKIDSLYEEILQIAFAKIEQNLFNGIPLDLNSEDFYSARALYEYAIEQWSNQNTKGAKELLFILLSLLQDEILHNSLMVHIIHAHKNTSLDDFYTKLANDKQNEDEKYGYFITNFNFDITKYLATNQQIIDEINSELANLVEK
jgi:hypothetical protein